MSQEIFLLKRQNCKVPNSNLLVEASNLDQGSGLQRVAQYRWQIYLWEFIQMKFIQSAAAIALTLGCALPAQATPTPIIETTCKWKGFDGSTLYQKCKIFGNSSAGAGTSFHIRWEDGMKTMVRASARSTQFKTESGRPAQIFGTYTFSRMGMPKRIQLEKLGNIYIDYDDYLTSTDYENF